MAFLCCGLNYKKNDIETYWCIETYLMKPVQKKFVDDTRIFSEVVETCICKKCGCQHLLVKRFGRAANGKKKLVETERMTGETADLFLLEKKKYLQLQEQKCPLPLIASATSLPYVYGAVIAPDKQRATKMNKYIIKNCGCIGKDKECWNFNRDNEYCKDYNCLLKQIVEKCKATICDGCDDNCTCSSKEILQLMDIEKV